MQSGKARTEGGKSGRIFARHEFGDILATESCVEIEVDQMVGDVAGQMGESAEMVEGRGDFGRTAKAVAHHAVGPVGLGGAGAHNAGDFLGQSAGARGAGGRIKVV